MHFSYAHQANGNKAGKFALVAGLHALIAVGVVNMMNNKALALPELPKNLTVFMTPEPVEPPPVPPEPPQPVQRVAPPDIVVPKIEIEITPPPIENTVRTTHEADPVPPQPAQPQATAQPPGTPASGNGTGSGAVRSIALAEASGCATPEYPARAARNGDSGTVVLALLIGTDGRVANARVQKTSGSRDLDKAALNALSMCQFKPGMNNGVPEAGWGQLAFVWTLDN
ncbi:TonB family protein [Massilia sp. YIM B02769]|uniref:energy transducer TonB n=1 Tax=unclassified Massilia TaxID=2609279 RepID=UPI0025B6C60E|nr:MULTISPECIES: energy transducer TonB [unclassified Massilia]MDN4061611.1 TonB family protein [Massilia sp. YIM B02769]